MMPFIYTQQNFWMWNNGKIDVSFNKPGWRDGLRYTKQLIDEGLLSPLSFTQDSTQMTSLISPDPTKVCAFVRISASNLGANDYKRMAYIQWTATALSVCSPRDPKCGGYTSQIFMGAITNTV
jgi:hypothetical protein